MAQWREPVPKILLSPHLLPVPRGILSTLYVSLTNGWKDDALRDLYKRHYVEDPFVRLLPEGQFATLAHVNYTNLCVLALTVVDEMLILTSAIDNLIKGASGQAVQNMNLMFHQEETAGLL